MIWSIILTVIIILLFIIGGLYYLRFWKEFRKLKVGQTLEKDFVEKWINDFKIGMTFIAAGSIVGLITVLLKK